MRLESTNRSERLLDRLARLSDPPAVRRCSPAEAKAVWKIRESGPRAALTVPGMAPRREGWDDASVAPAKLGAYLRDLRRLLDEYQYEAAYYGHFGHGCIHMQVSFDFETEAGIRTYDEFIDRAADLVVSYGGSLSGEHGDGQARATLLPKMFGPELITAFREFKTVWDPDNRMNPHKIVDAYEPTENLRLGADYAPLRLATHFAFPDDGGSFANAALRCTGLGACRKHDSGTMCPSYRATLEEAHSTRGRAHMLFEVLQGEALSGGWTNEQVKETLDLCLSCKACKSECPTNVDIATYRAEFLSHYYEGRKRPPEAHVFGFIDRWARRASAAPALANAALRLPGARAILNRWLSVAPERALPPLATESFSRWADRHNLRRVGEATSAATASRQVVLWVDTFNNYFKPEVSRAAVNVLQQAGCEVLVPKAPLCCGRPLYDYGFLDEAKAYLQQVLDSLAAPLEAGLPVIVLEPSCASVFRDELTNLFPHDARATRLRRQTRLLSEYLQHEVPAYEPPRLSERVLLHGHCHHKAVMTMTDEEALLDRMGTDVVRPDTGCCGMAGAFGFARDTYALSQAIGEQVLLPAVRETSPETLIVADGFSCQEQIRQATGRRVRHLAEVLQIAHERGTPAGEGPG